jgi:hypothetical protein
MMAVVDFAILINLIKQSYSKLSNAIAFREIARREDQLDENIISN